jgi:hypothetical protein
MTVLAEPADELGADEAAPADDHDLHGEPLSIASFVAVNFGGRPAVRR